MTSEVLFYLLEMSPRNTSHIYLPYLSQGIITGIKLQDQSEQTNANFCSGSHKNILIY